MREGALDEHLTIRIDRRLNGQIDAEMKIRETESAGKISRGALVRQLIRIGLAAVTGHRPD